MGPTGDKEVPGSTPSQGTVR